MRRACAPRRQRSRRIVGPCLVLLVLLYPTSVGHTSQANTPAAGGAPALVDGSTERLGASRGAMDNSSDTGFGDWPTYVHDAGRSGANLQERTLAASNASQLRVLWSAALGGADQATAVVHNGVVFVSSWDGYEYAFNASNGTQKWKTFIGATKFAACGYAGSRGTTSTATVSNGSVYIGGGDARFYALNASDGSVNWTVSEKVNNPSTGDYNWGSPLVVGATGYIGLSTACGNPSSQGAVISINLNGTTHGVLHVFAVVPAGQAGGSVWSTPSYDPATRLVWVSTGDEISASSGYYRAILALNASTLALVGAWQQGDAGVDYDFGAGPTLFHDGAGHPFVGATNKNGVFYALNRSNVSANGSWRPVWEDNVSWYANFSTSQQACGCALAPAAFDGSTLYLGGGYAQLSDGTDVAGTVRAVDPGNGSFEWTHASPGIVRAGVSFANGLIVDAADANDNLSATVEVLNASNGERLFALPVNGTVNAGPSIADGQIYFGTANWSGKGGGRLYALGIPLTGSVSSPGGSVLPGAILNLSGRGAGGMPPYSGTWNWGDGSNPSSGLTATHRYDRIGAYRVTLELRDNGSRTVNTTAELVVQASPINISEFLVSPSSPVVGDYATLIVQSSGGYSPLTYVYSGLPPGCDSQNTSALDCIPQASGPYIVQLGVSDRFGDVASANLSFTVASFARPLNLNGFFASAKIIAVGESVSIWSIVAGGAPPYTFTYYGLPVGCMSADQANLTCTPTQAGIFTVTVEVTDTSNEMASGALNLTVTAGPVPIFGLIGFWVNPPQSNLGTSVRILTVVTGSVGPVSYAYGGLPPGCSSENLSNFSCQPRSVGDFHVTVRASDAAGRGVTGSASVNVTPASSVVAPGGTSPGTTILIPAVAVAAGVGLTSGVLVGRLRWGRKRTARGRESNPPHS